MKVMGMGGLGDMAKDTVTSVTGNEQLGHAAGAFVDFKTGNFAGAAEHAAGAMSPENGNAMFSQFMGTTGIVGVGNAGGAGFNSVGPMSPDARFTSGGGNPAITAQGWQPPAPSVPGSAPSRQALGGQQPHMRQDMSSGPGFMAPPSGGGI